MEVKITKTIISQGKEFEINSRVKFVLLKNEKKYDCAGIITGIHEDKFVVCHALIDGFHVWDTLVLKYDEVEDGILYPTDTVGN